MMSSAWDVKETYDTRDFEMMHHFAECSVVQQKKRTVKWRSYWREVVAEPFFTHSLTVDQVNQPYTIHSDNI